MDQFRLHRRPVSQTIDPEEEAELRVYTRVLADGDTQVVFPRQWEEVDERLWRMHCDAVRQAQANRAEMLQGIATALTKLLGQVGVPK